MKTSDISKRLPKAEALPRHDLYFFIDIKTDYCENFVHCTERINIPVSFWDREEVVLVRKLSEWIQNRVVHLNLIDL